jgi:hypothetical protein
MRIGYQEAVGSGAAQRSHWRAGRAAVVRDLVADSVGRRACEGAGDPGAGRRDEAHP